MSGQLSSSSSLSHDADSGGGSSSSDDDFDHSPTVQVDARDVASRENVFSTGWMFTGEFVVDITASKTVQFSPQILANMFAKLAAKPPVKVEHMIIFADFHIVQINSVIKTSIHGYVQGSRASEPQWKTWLGQENFLWTPLWQIALSDEYQEDDRRAQELASTWFVLGKYGMRNQFRILCTAFTFQTMLDVKIGDFNIEQSYGVYDCEASYVLQLVRTKFMETINITDFHRKGSKFILVQCDLRPLTDAAPGSTVNVHIQGFVQSKQTDLRTWNHISEEAYWRIAPGGLCNCEEFTRAIHESSPWATVYKFGELKISNTGRMASKQASIRMHHTSLVARAVPPPPRSIVRP
jgi:hypothetical protein